MELKFRIPEVDIGFVRKRLKYGKMIYFTGVTHLDNGFIGVIKLVIITNWILIRCVSCSVELKFCNREVNIGFFPPQRSKTRQKVTKW